MESFLYTPCKGTDIKACIVSNMVKHSKYVGVHWGFCAVFFCTHKEIQFLVCTVAPINKCILIA